MKRGDIYWVVLDPTVGSEIKKIRPCVLVGATPINQARRTIVVVPLSSVAKPLPPINVPVHCLGKNGVAVCDQIRTIDKSRLVNGQSAKKSSSVEPIGHLSVKDLHALDEGLRQVLSL